MEQSGNKHTFRILDILITGYKPGAYPAKDAVLPEHFHVDDFGRYVFKDTRDIDPDSESAQLFRTDNVYSAGYGVDF